MSGVTSKDIAAQLGLSQAAVSIVLNGKPGVSEATRRLVIETAKKLGYSPSKLAAVVSRRKKICFIFYVDELVSIAESTTFSAFVLKGAETAASLRGYSIIVRYVHAGEPFVKQLEDINSEIDGFIIFGTDITDRTESEIKGFLLSVLPRPTVIIDNPINFGIADCVTNDNFSGARSAVQYLIDRGCRKIGYLRSRFRNRNFRLREAGLNDALREAELKLDSVMDIDVSFDEAYAEIDGYLSASPELPDGFFAENDIIAAAAIRAFNAHGIKVPDEVSIIGFDDISICELTAPSLSTVHSYKEQLGNTAINILTYRFSSSVEGAECESEGAMNIRVSTKLCIRDSVR